MDWWIDGGGEEEEGESMIRSKSDSKMERWLPGGVLPVNPSTLRVSKHLQKFDPSDYPSGAVRKPSGSRQIFKAR
jgi:hypothetical protein